MTEDQRIAELMKPDGVHTFRQMEELALDWKRKYYDMLDKILERDRRHRDFMDEIAKALKIQTGRESYWDTDDKGRLQIILQKIKKLSKPQP